MMKGIARIRRNLEGNIAVLLDVRRDCVLHASRFRIQGAVNVKEKDRGKRFRRGLRPQRWCLGYIR
jgi:hypothetical protein